MARTDIDSRFFLSRHDFEPAYLRLFRSGELARRVDEAVAGLADCRVCPRDCGVDRLAAGTAVCKTGRDAVVSSAFAHFGEEDPLRGWRGSGTIFFSLCNLRCVFCQNHDISHARAGQVMGAAELASTMLALQDAGCHNINFVTPEHVVPQMLAGVLLAAAAGLRLPIVYNTSAYDSLPSLALLDGVVDIYMPDFKMWDERAALRYLKARDYPAVARRVIKEMQRQVGPLKLDEDGLARRGLLVRHLVMPGQLDQSEAIMNFLAREVSPDTYVNVMGQYYPAARVGGSKYPEINRRARDDEVAAARRAARAAGLWRLDGHGG